MGYLSERDIVEQSHANGSMARGSRLRNEVDGDASEEDGPAGSGDQANDYAESSGLDSGSGDDYVDEDEEEEGGEEGDAEEPPEDDEIFK